MVEVVAAERNDDVVTLISRDVDGRLDQLLVTVTGRSMTEKSEADGSPPGPRSAPSYRSSSP